MSQAAGRTFGGSVYGARRYRLAYERQCRWRAVYHDLMEWINRTRKYAAIGIDPIKESAKGLDRTSKPRRRAQRIRRSEPIQLDSKRFDFGLFAASYEIRLKSNLRKA